MRPPNNLFVPPPPPWKFDPSTWNALPIVERTNIMSYELSRRGFMPYQIHRLLTEAGTEEEEKMRKANLSRIFGMRWNSVPYLSYSPRTHYARRMRFVRNHSGGRNMLIQPPRFNPVTKRSVRRASCSRTVQKFKNGLRLFGASVRKKMMRPREFQSSRKTMKINGAMRSTSTLISSRGHHSNLYTLSVRKRRRFAQSPHIHPSYPNTNQNIISNSLVNCSPSFTSPKMSMRSYYDDLSATITKMNTTSISKKNQHYDDEITVNSSEDYLSSPSCSPETITEAYDSEQRQVIGGFLRSRNFPPSPSSPGYESTEYGCTSSAGNSTDTSGGNITGSDVSNNIDCCTSPELFSPAAAREKYNRLSRKTIDRRYKEIENCALKRGLSLENNEVRNVIDLAFDHYDNGAVIEFFMDVTSILQKMGEKRGALYIKRYLLPLIRDRLPNVKVAEDKAEASIFEAYGRNVIEFMQVLGEVSEKGSRVDESRHAFDTLCSAILPSPNKEQELPELWNHILKRARIHHRKLSNAKHRRREVHEFVDNKRKLAETYNRCQEEFDTFFSSSPGQESSSLWKVHFQHTLSKDITVNEMLEVISANYEMSKLLLDNLCFSYRAIARINVKTRYLTAEANGDEKLCRVVKTPEESEHVLTIQDLTLCVREISKLNDIPFATVKSQKTRKDNIDNLIHKHVSAFCHDDDYARLDSNQSRIYKSTDWNGDRKECARKYWINSGSNDISQLKLFKVSIHYTRLCKDAKESAPESYSNREPCVSISNFQKYKCVCVKAKGHAPCVDVIQDTVESKIECLADYLSEKTNFRRNLSAFQEKFQTCTTCSHCPAEIRSESNWLNLLKLQSGSTSLLSQICNKALCPCEEHRDLTLPEDEKVFKLRSLKCSMGECEHCSIEDNLPFNCDAFMNCQDTVLCWTWEHLKEGDSQRTPVKKPMTISSVTETLKQDLKKYIAHSFHLKWQKRMIKIDQEAFDDDTIVFYTDYASGIDMVARKKECCAHDPHAVLLCLVALHGRDLVKLKNGEEIDFKNCDQWFCVTASQGEGKMSDWMTHNSVLDHILDHYICKLGNNYKKLIVWTDNCPPQYKNRQNLFQLARLMMKYKLDFAEHRFACIYGFKGVWDALGKTSKNIVAEYEDRHEVYAFKAYHYYIILRNHFAQNHSDDNDWMSLKEERSFKLKNKTTMMATNRYMIYGTDNIDEYDRISSNPTVTILGDNSAEARDPFLKDLTKKDRIIFLDRPNKKKEDTTAVPRTNSYFQFILKRSSVKTATGLCDSDHCALIKYLSSPEGRFPLRSNVPKDVKNFLTEFLTDSQENNMTNDSAVPQKCPHCRIDFSPQSFLAHKIFCEENPLNTIFPIIARKRPCSCINCRGMEENNNPCKYAKETGDFCTPHEMMDRKQGLKRDSIKRAIKAVLETNNVEDQKMQDIIDVIKSKMKFTEFPNKIPSENFIACAPTFELQSRKIVVSQMKSVVSFLGLIINGTGTSGSILKADMVIAIEQAGGWKAIVHKWVTLAR